jgi:hypothetical protein
VTFARKTLRQKLTQELPRVSVHPFARQPHPSKQEILKKLNCQRPLNIVIAHGSIEQKGQIRARKMHDWVPNEPVDQFDIRIPQYNCPYLIWDS